ncbi:hypothetical protein GCM10010095_61300 [Streptomyces anthocyanicus]|nr:hypothetical protein GCM10010095_61300 [Streptomyces anthocyanicus]
MGVRDLPQISSTVLPLRDLSNEWLWPVIGGDAGRPSGQESHVVTLGWFQQGCETADKIGELGHLRACRSEPLQQSGFLRAQILGSVSRRRPA